MVVLLCTSRTVLVVNSTLRRWKSRSRVTPDGCWLWQGSSYNGYGRVSFGGMKLKVHRAAYEIAFGPIPEGSVVHHKCGNRLCFRPGHLQAVTPAENSAESFERQSLKRRIAELEKLLEGCTCQSDGCEAVKAERKSFPHHR